jgi:hypothetical protein
MGDTKVANQQSDSAGEQLIVTEVSYQSTPSPQLSESSPEAEPGTKWAGGPNQPPEDEGEESGESESSGTAGN